MLKYFPVLTDEKIKKFTEVIHKSEIDDKDRIVPLQSGHKIVKIVPFDEGYEFLKDSDLQYNLRTAFLEDDLDNWVEYYDISDEEDEEKRKYWLKELYQTIGSVYKN